MPRRCSLPEIMMYYFSSRPAGEWYNVLESDYFDTLHVLLVPQVIADADNMEVVSFDEHLRVCAGSGRNEASSWRPIGPIMFSERSLYALIGVFI